MSKKSLSISIIGRPNAGKSTLLNRIIGEKISIVTHKAQTTRSIITGILTIKDTQLIFLDTPGIFNPKTQIDRKMVRCAWSSIADTDIIVLIIDSSREPHNPLKEIVKRISSLNKDVIFLMNKTDIKSKYYLNNIELLPKEGNNKIFNISALDGSGVEYFLDYIYQKAAKQNWVYSKDDITNLSVRFLACEITREQLFLQLDQELPYNLRVESEKWEEIKNAIKVYQVILVSKRSYKKMIIGKNGSAIKNIGIEARKNIEKLTRKKIHLFLYVKLDLKFMEKDITIFE